jgi:hypothetical protein
MKNRPFSKLLALYGGECQKSVDFAYGGYYNEFSKGETPQNKGAKAPK